MTTVGGREFLVTDGVAIPVDQIRLVQLEEDAKSTDNFVRVATSDGEWTFFDENADNLCKLSGLKLPTTRREI